MLTVGERTESEYELYQRMGEKWAADLRVAMPGIIQSFDPIEQTVSVQPAIQERIVDQLGNISSVNLPILLDVPIVFPRAGGFALTMPIHVGDECLLVFADMCIDAWWSLGGVNMQAEKRRHDLSDAFAILGAWSQKKRLANYNNTVAQLRTEDGTQRIEISSNSINLIGNILKNGVAL